MPRERTGSIKFIEDRKVFVVRLTYFDETGKRHDLRRQAETRTEAKNILKKLKRELDDHGPALIDADKLTFKKLAAVYEERKLQPPVYKGDTKIAGLRSYKIQQIHLRSLAAYFGMRHIKTITHSDIEEFRLKRMNAPVVLRNGKGEAVRTRQRSVAHVNRELSLLRAVFGFAKRSGWLIRHPFEMGGPLISAADEVRRDRVLTRDEEGKLLDACSGKRSHVRPILIAALDTAMRRGELLALRWSDIDFAGEVIRVRATTTKTMRARAVGMTSRLKEELSRLYEAAPPGDEIVFGVRDNFKHAWQSSCRLAGVADFRFHDCRHTAITRMIEMGMPPLQVMTVSGHTQMQTFLRYLSADDQAVKRAAAALDQYHDQTRGGTELIN